jgi:hypothetical protein
MYQLVLCENNKNIKVLYTYQRKYDAFYRLNVLSKKNISLKKEIVYKDKKLTKVNYRIILLKEKEGDEKSIVIRDEYGKLLDNLVPDNKWVIVGECPFNLEEQYSVSGANRKLSAEEILKNVLLNKLSEKNIKQVLILNNKIIIDSLVLNMVTCKNVDEAIRLYNYLRVFCFDNKTQNVLFFGKIQKTDKKIWYKKINEVTGIDYNRLYRNTSR